jgi:hypothetical protein
MDELVQWLRAQLDEDERIARETHPVFLRWDYDEFVKEIRDLGNGNEIASGVIPRYGAFIAEHDPARVLREIDAKRRMLDAYAGVAANDVNEVEYAHGYANALGEAVRLLALPYVDRPGYREEWRP